MFPPFKIAVIGGTGKSGTYLVRELLRRSCSLRLLVRQPVGELPAEVIVGNAIQLGDIRRLLTGCTAVISTLGIGRPPSEPTIFSQTTRNVLQIMAETGIRRYIVTTGLNVDVSGDNKGPVTTAGTHWMKETFPVSTADKQTEYDLLAASTVDWTLVRLPSIELTDELSPVVADLRDCPGDRISAAGLACFLADQLVSDAWIGKAPFLANVLS